MNVGPAWLNARMADGDVVVIDGATGTELQARGVPMVDKGWSVMAQLEHPEVLQQLYEDYIRAGASVIIANTFAAGRHLLEPGGLGDRVAEAHTRAVEIAHAARDAVGRQVAIAGSLSTYMADVTDQYWLDRVDDTYNEQVELLVDAGVDLIACEMMQHVERSDRAVRAAKTGGLPVWAGFTTQQAHDGSLVNFDYPDTPLAASVDPILEQGVDLVCVMHTPVPAVSAALDFFGARWTGPVGVYPEAGYFTEPEWHFVDVIEPADLVAAAWEWVAAGVQVLGGCCGLGVQHIEALSREFDPESRVAD